MFCSYENQTGFDGSRIYRRACSDCGWLLLLADEHSAFLEVGAGCGDWFSPGALCVYPFPYHFIYFAHTIATITSYTECFVDQCDLTNRLNVH